MKNIKVTIMATILDITKRNNVLIKSVIEVEILNKYKTHRMDINVWEMWMVNRGFMWIVATDLLLNEFWSISSLFSIDGNLYWGLILSLTYLSRLINIEIIFGINENLELDSFRMNWNLLSWMVLLLKDSWMKIENCWIFFLENSMTAEILWFVWEFLMLSWF